MKTFRPLAALGLALPLLASACAAGGNVPAGTSPNAAMVQPGQPPVAAVVVLENFSFGPATVTIRAGQTIEWVWRDPGIPHNVTFGSFQSQTQTAGTYFHTFDQPGTYHYVCTLHYDMQGVVIVR